MEDNQVKIKDVQEFLLTYHEGECSIPDVPDLSKIFASITKAKLWRYDHYSLLENLAESFLPDDHPALAKITEYDHQLAGFRETTRIIDFIKVSDQEDPEDDGHPIAPKRYNRRYRQLTAKVKIDPSVPLDYVEKLWKALMKKFELPELTAIIDKIEEGSLSITWLVLPHIAEKIRATFYKCITFFQHYNILEITLYAGLLLYNKEWMRGSTSLYWASFAGNTEEIEALLEAGADINEKNDNADGHTPLIGACMGCGDIDTVRLLLTRGAVVDVQDKNGKSALIVASLYSHTDVVELLLEHKAQVNLHAASECTALIYACSYGNTDTVKMLLAHGAILDHREKKGVSALVYASIVGNTDTVKVLLKHGATVDLTNDDGHTALEFASSFGQTDTAQVLLEGGANVNVKSNNGVTALWAACYGDHPDTVKLLVDFKADVNLPYDVEDGGTVLTIACREGHTQTALVLLASAAIVDYPDKHGQTPLHHAALNGHSDIVSILLEYKAGVDLQNKDGWTALHLTAQQGHVQVVETLLRHGASINVKSKTGLTALDVALDGSHQAVCKLLEQRGAKVNSELTEAQRKEVKSVGERIWYEFKKFFLRDIIEKKERIDQVGPSRRVVDKPRGRRSLAMRFRALFTERSV